jgi:hypothetical protein
MSDSPEKIYLQPPCCVDPEFGQVWCDHVPTDCPDDAPWTEYIRADLVQAQLAQAREQSDEFRNAYQRLFNRRAMRVVDLKIKVWEALNRRACPDGFMHIATEAIMEYGCGEIADLKKALELKDAELQQAREQVAAMEPVEGDVLPAIGTDVLIHLNSSDGWVKHTVVGYYVWGDHGGNPRLQRVFVRVKDKDGHLNARMLCDVRRTDATPFIKPPQANPAERDV